MTSRLCPYCAEAIEPAAIVCRHCTRDLFFVKPMMDRIDALTDRLSALETAFAETAPPTLEEDRAAPPAEKAGTVPEPVAVLPAPALPPAASWRWSAPVVAVIALVALHALLIVLLDTRLVYLRLLSIFLPFAAGFFFRLDARASLWIDACIGLLVAALSVFAMLALVSQVDAVPLLPHGRAEWSEVFQYALSISLGFFSGALMRRVVLLAFQSEGSAGILSQLARAIARDIVGGVEDASFEKRLKKLEGLLTTVVAIGAAVFSAILGLGRFLG